ncbi:MAG TPA: hypothetical protein EYQ42_12085 [Thiotrichaceae bacterium]|jgi:hypothetical protein|nr:hypothetical protein [Thiotrichaceae bacterium]
MSKQIEQEKSYRANPLYPNIRLVNRSELPQDVQDAMNSAVVPINVELSNLVGEVESLVGKYVRSYNFKDTRDWYVEGVIVEESDEFFKVRVEKQVANGNSLRSFTKYDYPNIFTADIEIIEREGETE